MSEDLHLYQLFPVAKGAWLICNYMEMSKGGVAIM